MGGGGKKRYEMEANGTDSFTVVRRRGGKKQRAKFLWFIPSNSNENVLEEIIRFEEGEGPDKKM